MSRATALIRFKDGTIMHGCYQGTSDVLYPYLITEEKLQQEYEGSVFRWNDKCQEFGFEGSTQLEIKDEEEVEIYEDYGSGASWKGKASRSKMIVTEGCIRDDADWYPPVVPEWVIAYYKDKRYSTERFQSV